MVFPPANSAGSLSKTVGSVCPNKRHGLIPGGATGTTVRGGLVLTLHPLFSYQVKDPEKRVQEVAINVKSLCVDLETATQQWLRQWQHETITFAIGIAEKLLARQIESDPSILISWIEDSVRLIQGQRQILLRIHPEDAQRLSSALSELVDDMKPSVEIQVVEDIAVGKFGVILQTPDTTIDRSLQTQLKRLVEELQ